MKYTGYEFTKGFEGERLEAYQDTGGVWTIGVGHTGKEVKKGLKITSAQSKAYFDEDVKEAEDAVTKVVKVKLTQHQFDALVDMTFNIGVEAFTNSTLLKMLNRGDYTDAACQLLRWNKDNGKIVTGLVRRCEARKKLFES